MAVAMACSRTPIASRSAMAREKAHGRMSDLWAARQAGTSWVDDGVSTMSPTRPGS